MTGIPGVYGRPERGRRPRPLLLGLLAVLALLAVVGWMNYDPIVRGDAGWCPVASVLVPDGEVDEVAGSQGVVCTVANVDAATVAFATTVRNDGPLPVRVRATRLQGEIQGVLRVEDVRMTVRGDVADATPGELVSFRAFRLGPAEQRLIEVRGTLTPCEEVGSARAATFRSLPLRTTLLALPRDSEAPFDPPVRLIAEPC